MTNPKDLLDAVRFTLAAASTFEDAGKAASALLEYMDEPITIAVSPEALLIVMSAVESGPLTVEITT